MGTKLTRKNQKIFGASGMTGPTGSGYYGPTGVLGQFGSYKNNAIIYSVDPDILQALSAWGEGIGGAIINNSPPSIQDMNSVMYVLTKNLFGIYESGIPEWNHDMIYEVGSCSIDRTTGIAGVTGVHAYGIFTSITANNLNHNVGDSSYWDTLLPQPGFSFITGTTGSTGNLILNNDSNVNYHVYYCGTMTMNIPSPMSAKKGRFIWFILQTTVVGVSTITFVPSAGTINGASSFSASLTTYLAVTGNPQYYEAGTIGFFVNSTSNNWESTDFERTIV